MVLNIKYCIIACLFLLCFFSSVYTQEIKIGTSSSVQTLNPLFAYRWEDMQIIDLVFEGLIHREGKEIVCDLAVNNPTEWTAKTKNNNVIITVDLNKDISWHLVAGYSHIQREVEAKDFVETFNQMKIVQSPVKNKIRNLNKLDEVKKHRISLEYSQDKYTNLVYFNLDFKILPFEVFEMLDTMTQYHDFGLQPQYTVGCGKYKLTQIGEVTRLELNKNDYLKMGVINSRIMRRRCPKQEIGIQEVAIGDLDLFVDYDARFTAIVKAQKNIENHIMPSATLSALIFNHLANDAIIDELTDSEYYHRKTVEKFQELEVRKAIAHAINANKILEDTYAQESAWRISGPLFPSGVYNRTVQCYSYNVDVAKTLIAKHEMEDMEISILCVQIEGLQSFYRVAEGIVKNLKEAGIKNVKISAATTGKFDELVKRGEFDLVIFDWATNYLPDLTLWDKPSGCGYSNYWGYESPDQGFYDAIERTLNPSNKNVISDYYYIHKKLNEDYAAVWLWNREIKIARQKDLHITTTDPFNFFRSIPYWRKLESKKD